MDYRKMKIEYVRYNHGSEAYKLEPSQPVRSQPVRKKAPKAAPQSVKTVELSIDPLALIAICMTVFMVVCMLVGYSRLQTAQAELENMEAYVRILEKEKSDRQAKLDEVLDLEALRKAALSLGMVPIEEADHLTVTMDTPAQ